MDSCQSQVMFKPNTSCSKLEEEHAELDCLYGSFLEAWEVLSRPGLFWVFLIPGVVALLIWKEEYSDIDVIFLVFCSSISLYSLFLFKKYFPIYKTSKHKIRIREIALEDESGLRYCFCGLYSHIYCPSSEKLWSHKNKILFDHHSNIRYRKWHNRYHGRNELNYGRLFVVVGAAVLGFVLMMVIILILSKALT